MTREEKIAVVGTAVFVLLLVLGNIYLMSSQPALNPFFMLVTSTVYSVICGLTTLLISLFTKTYKLTFFTLSSAVLNLFGCYLSFVVFKPSSGVLTTQIGGIEIFLIAIAILTPVTFVLQLIQLRKFRRLNKMRLTQAL